MKITAIEPTQNSIVLQTIALLICYGFEIKGQTTDKIVEGWLKKYTPIWLRLATIEALYLGRYKTVSVEHILNSWLRKGNAAYHFNHDFERLICRKLPDYLQNIKEHCLSDNNHLEDRSGSDRQKPIQFSQPIISETKEERKFLPNKPESNLSAPNPPSANSRSPKTKQQLLTLERETLPVQTKSKAKKPVVPYKPNWICTSKVQKSIEQFTPLPDRSQFYLKLKAVARQHFT